MPHSALPARFTRLPESVLELMYRLTTQSPLDQYLVRAGFAEIVRIREDRIRDALVGSVLTGLLARGASADEVVPLLEVVADLDNLSIADRPLVTVDGPHRVVVVQGSGKKGIKTVNISTPSCILAAAAGAPVVKVGSRGTGSLTGASDFLGAVGFNPDVRVRSTIEMLERIGFGFFNSEITAPSFFRIYKGLFYVPHALVFGISPLLSPIRGDVTLYGLSHPDVGLSARVLVRLGLTDVDVVTTTHDGIHYIDEVGVFGTTSRAIAEAGQVSPTVQFMPAREFGLGQYDPADIQQGPSTFENVRATVLALAGRGTAAHADLLCVNAAVILQMARVTATLREGFSVARDRLRGGAALTKLRQVVGESGGSLERLDSYVNGSHDGDRLRRDLAGHGH
jgi:anthranilate phosphoribosyltransferase